MNDVNEIFTREKTQIGVDDGMKMTEKGKCSDEEEIPKRFLKVRTKRRLVFRKYKKPGIQNSTSFNDQSEAGISKPISDGDNDSENVKTLASSTKTTQSSPKKKKISKMSKNRFGFRKSSNAVKEPTDAGLKTRQSDIMSISKDDLQDKTSQNGQHSLSQERRISLPLDDRVYTGPIKFENVVDEDLDLGNEKKNTSEEERDINNECLTATKEENEDLSTKQPKSLRAIAWKKIVNSKIIANLGGSNITADDGVVLEDQEEIKYENSLEIINCAVDSKEVVERDSGKKGKSRSFVKRIKKRHTRKAITAAAATDMSSIGVGDDKGEKVGHLVLTKTADDSDVRTGFKRKHSFDNVMDELERKFSEVEIYNNDDFYQEITSPLDDVDNVDNFMFEQSDLTDVSTLATGYNDTFVSVNLNEAEKTNQETEDPAEITQESAVSENAGTKTGTRKLDYVLIDPITEKPMDESFHLSKKALRVYKKARLSRAYCQACCSVM